MVSYEVTGVIKDYDLRYIGAKNTKKLLMMSWCLHLIYGIKLLSTENLTDSLRNGHSWQKKPSLIHLDMDRTRVDRLKNWWRSNHFSSLKLEISA